MRADRRYLQYAAFLGAFFLTIDVMAVGVPLLIVPAAIGAAYSPYPDSPFLVYAPAIAIPVIVIAAFLTRRAQPGSWLAQGFFFGTITGTLILAIAFAGAVVG